LQRPGQQRLKGNARGKSESQAKPCFDCQAEERDGGDEAEGYGKDLRADQGPLEAFDGGVAAAKLGHATTKTPGSLKTRGGMGLGDGTVLAEGLGEEHELAQAWQVSAWERRSAEAAAGQWPRSSRLFTSGWRGQVRRGKGHFHGVLLSV